MQLAAALAALASAAVLACGSPPRGVAPAAPPCTPPIAPATSEVRATFGHGGACVALVDAELSAVSARPTAWHRDAGGRWREVAPPGDAELLANSGWVAMAADGATIVAALDSRVESPGWELAVVRSTDGGATWQGPAIVKKPYYLAVVESIALTGRAATLVVTLDDDYGAGVTPGRYRATSADGGATWGSVRLAAR